MSTHSYNDWRKQLAWGLILIAVGLAVFLQKMDVIEFFSLWHHWPLFVVAIGAVKMITYTRPGEFTSGLWTVLLGLWLHFVFEGMFGLTFRNSWPLVIIACGAVMIIEPLVKDRNDNDKELANEK